MLFVFLRRLLVRFSLPGVLLALVIGVLLHDPAPDNFSQAKQLAREHVYHDRNASQQPGTLYCGCNWHWTGTSGGRTDLASCGYRVRSQDTRANRIEWEHVVPASWMGQQRQCWQQGGRKNCSANDPFFSRMEADLHNLAPAIGEVNADRSNYAFAMVSARGGQYGRCNSKTDFKQRKFEPRNEVKGMVARVNFYVHDRYDLRMSKQQQQLFMRWHQQYPPSQWELERDRRIAKIMGHSNDFVTGKRSWSLGHRNSAAGLHNDLPMRMQRLADQISNGELEPLLHKTAFSLSQILQK